MLSVIVGEKNDSVLMSWLVLYCLLSLKINSPHKLTPSWSIYWFRCTVGNVCESLAVMGVPPCLCRIRKHWMISIPRSKHVWRLCWLVLSHKWLECCSRKPCISGAGFSPVNPNGADGLRLKWHLFNTKHFCTISYQQNAQRGSATWQRSVTDLCRSHGRR